MKAWRRRKRAEFDEAVAAKEGVEDRRREWANWVDELEKKGIDRYELPFYLLVGEPQSGKSMLLHNSDLHFPFGQNRLSGLGGTRGCDWWFTEEAVILDLAGRLFTARGRRRRPRRVRAFLQLLYDFRPLCPANGVILVVPCDALLSDSEEVCVAKANKIKEALDSLTGKLQAQLPVYLVLTKGDRIFGFAECVHRLDVERRHQMFGWSREATRVESPFDEAEVLAGFDGMVERARLLRAHMAAGARIPEALPEVDRMFAFPHELAGMRGNLEIYLKRVFTSASVMEKLFFRGLYLTSGLQSGVPIAKVCTDLFGQAGEADQRSLEALFSKSRAYFIKDLVRNRVFAERGLVRPTQGRVQQTRRSTTIAYGFSGALVLLSVLFAAIYLVTGRTDARTDVLTAALEAGDEAAARDVSTIPQLLADLQKIGDAAVLDPGMYEETLGDTRDEYKELYCKLFDARLTPLVKKEVLKNVRNKLTSNDFTSHTELLAICHALGRLTGDVDLADDGVREDVLAGLGANPISLATTASSKEPLDLERAFVLRESYGDDRGLFLPYNEAERDVHAQLVQLAIDGLEKSLQPGAATAPRGEVGVMFAWHAAEKAHELLLRPKDLPITKQKEAQLVARRYAGAMGTMQTIHDLDLDAEKTIYSATVFVEFQKLVKLRREFVAFLSESSLGGTRSERWPDADEVIAWTFGQMEKTPDKGAFSLSSLGFHFGSQDAGQTLFQLSESAVSKSTARIHMDSSDFDPLSNLSQPPGMLALCNAQLPLELANGGVAGLAERIADLDGRVLATFSPGSEVYDLFLQQCIQLAFTFGDSILSVDQALRSVVGDAADPPARRLCVDFVTQYAMLHRQLLGMIEKKGIAGNPAAQLRAWCEKIEAHLYEHLDKLDKPDRWMPEIDLEGRITPEGWSALRALALAAKVKPVRPESYSVDQSAREALQDAFENQVSQLIDRWDRLDPEDHLATHEIVGQLAALCSRVKNELDDGEAIVGTSTHQGLSERIDQLLARRLENLVELVERIWSPDIQRGTFTNSINEAYDALKSLQSKIDASQKAGLSVVADVTDDLAIGGDVTGWFVLPQVTEWVRRLGECAIPRSPSEVTNYREHRELLEAIDVLKRVQGRPEELGREYARVYYEEFSTASVEASSAAQNAGVRFVRSMRAKVTDVLRAEVARRYLGELETVVGRPNYDDLLDAMFWTVEEGELDVDDGKRVRDPLDDLLKPRIGDFDKLRSAYLLIGEQRSIGDEIFPVVPAPGEDAWTRFHRFLVDLQTFLLADGARTVKAAKFDFTLQPKLGDSGSLWDFSGIGTEAREYFYFPGDDSSDALQRQHSAGDMSSLRVSDWGFAVNRPQRAMEFIWSSKPVSSEARTDPDRYDLRVRTCLAPLLLAWSGTVEDPDDPRRFEFTLSPKRTTRQAPFWIEFDMPLPLRPTRP
ncbi:MAG: type VI secretion protein IcmF/TssM N-terminal domain-containing protein [Planctomycetota bacterium]